MPVSCVYPYDAEASAWFASIRRSVRRFRVCPLSRVAEREQRGRRRPRLRGRRGVPTGLLLLTREMRRRSDTSVWWIRRSRIGRHDGRRDFERRHGSRGSGRKWRERRNDRRGDRRNRSRAFLRWNKRCRCGWLYGRNAERRRFGDGTDGRARWFGWRFRERRQGGFGRLRRCSDRKLRALAGGVELAKRRGFVDASDLRHVRRHAAALRRLRTSRNRRSRRGSIALVRSC